MQKFHIDWFNIFTINVKIISDFKFEILISIYWNPTPFIMNSYLVYTDIIRQFIVELSIFESFNHVSEKQIMLKQKIRFDKTF